MGLPLWQQDWVQNDVQEHSGRLPSRPDSAISFFLTAAYDLSCQWYGVRYSGRLLVRRTDKVLSLGNLRSQSMAKKGSDSPKIVPLGDRVVLKRESALSKTAGGI